MTRWLARDFIIGFLVVMTFVLSGAVLYGFIRLGHDESSTCSIQARGLPAGHDLAASMKDIHALLTTPPTTPAQRVAAARTPATVARTLHELDGHLAAYLAAEAAQPHHRGC